MRAFNQGHNCVKRFDLIKARGPYLSNERNLSVNFGGFLLLGLFICWVVGCFLHFVANGTVFFFDTSVKVQQNILCAVSVVIHAYKQKLCVCYSTVFLKFSLLILTVCNAENQKSCLQNQVLRIELLLSSSSSSPRLDACGNDFLCPRDEAVCTPTLAH